MSSSKPAWRRRIGRVSVYQRGERNWTYYRQGKQFRISHGTMSAAAVPTRRPAVTLRIRCHSNPTQDLDEWIDARTFLRRNFPEALAAVVPGTRPAPDRG